MKPILYLSNQAGSNSVTAALEATGHQVVSTYSRTQAIALMFLISPVAAVVLHDRMEEEAILDVARSTRSIHPEVPIILLSGHEIDHLPPCVDACVSTGHPGDDITSAVRFLLAEKPESFRRQGCESLQVAQA